VNKIALLEVLKRHHKIENNGDFVQRATRDVQMTAELSRTATTRTFRNVQHDAVGGPPPLIGEGIALFGRELLDPGTGLDRDIARELPRSKVPIVRHDATKVWTSWCKPGTNSRRRESQCRGLAP